MRVLSYTRKYGCGLPAHVSHCFYVANDCPTSCQDDKRRPKVIIGLKEAGLCASAPTLVDGARCVKALHGREDTNLHEPHGELSR